MRSSGLESPLAPPQPAHLPELQLQPGAEPVPASVLVRVREHGHETAVLSLSVSVPVPVPEGRPPIAAAQAVQQQASRDHQPPG